MKSETIKYLKLLGMVPTSIKL